MLNQANQLDQVNILRENQKQPDNSVTKKLINTSGCPNKFENNIDTEQNFLPECIRLSFDDLKSFETLYNQFEDWGIIFDNCLVIQPSNPAFPSRSGLKVVMGSPKSGLLEINFLRPVSWVSGLVTSSQRLIVCAYDQNGELLDESVLPKANLANSGSDIPPNTMLSVSAYNIRKVKFFCFDGNFTLDEFRFCVST